MQSIFLIGLVLAAFLYFRCGKLKTENSSDSDAPLSQGFSKTGDTIYFYDKVLQDVDVQSFSILDDSYARDNKHVYYYAVTRPSKDYFTTKKLIFEALKDVRPGEFLALGYGYGKDSSQAYYETKPFTVKDVMSLEVLDHHWVKDKQAVYLDQKEISGIDGHSFDILSSSYAQDKHHVYYFEGLHDGHPEVYPLSENPLTFKLLEFPFSRDDNAVYFRHELIQGADASNFTLLGAGYARDQKQIYFETRPLNVSDLNSFTVCKENENLMGEGAFAKDKYQVFYREAVIPNADPHTFIVLNDGYSKDQKTIYYKTSPVKKADATSFSVFPHDMGDSDAKDKNHHYFRGKIVENPE